jgi:hypothetical protein
MISEITTIRPVKKNEVVMLKQISEFTFLETYASENTEEDMDAYLSENFSIESLTRQLSNPDSFFFFAELQDKIVGYLKLNRGKAQTDSKLSQALEIERIYVHPDYQRRKIGHSLLRKTYETARSMHLKTVWLGVWTRNLKAIAFYKKNGFIVFAEHMFYVGSDAQKDVLMKIELD